MATSTIKSNGDNRQTITVTEGVYAYKKGNVVTVVWNNAPVTSTTQRTLYGTLPVGWRPPRAAFGTQINGNTGYTDVDASGAVEGFRPTSGVVTGYVTYITA